MKATLAPYVSGMDLPSHAVWLPVDARTAVGLLALYKAKQTRPWHTISFFVYDLIGTRACYIAYTWLPTPKDLQDLKEFLHL